MREPKNMDCSHVNQLLSAYYDDELAPESRTAVAEHVAGCAACARELAGFRQLSALAAGLAEPAPPADAWQQLEAQLDAPRGRKAAGAAPAGWLEWLRQPAVARLGFAAAAVLLLAVGWFGYQAWSERAGAHAMAAVFAQYLDEFQRDPEAAQQVLLAHYDARAVDARQAAQAVGYHPAAADGLPGGSSVESTYVMKMPCCTCVQCVCKRSDGTTFTVFEHGDCEPCGFEGRPATQARCNGKACSLVPMDGRLAATWQHGKRQITVVGARDAAEVTQLVAWFDERRPTGLR